MSVERGIAEVSLDAVRALVNAAVVVVLGAAALTALFLVHVDAVLLLIALAALAVVVRVGHV